MAPVFGIDAVDLSQSEDAAVPSGGGLYVGYSDGYEGLAGEREGWRIRLSLLGRQKSGASNHESQRDARNDLSHQTPFVSGPQINLCSCIWNQTPKRSPQP